MEDKKGRRERNREAITRAAKELFRSHGFKRVSMEDVARQAGVSPATVYNHFGDKNSLIYAAIRAVLDEKMDRYRQAMGGGQPFSEQLESLIYEKTESFDAYQGELFQAMTQGNPEVTAFIAAVKQETDELVGNFYRDGVAQGYIKPGLSLETVMLYCEVLRQGFIACMPKLTAAEDGAKVTKELLSLFLYGLVGDKDK